MILIDYNYIIRKARKYRQHKIYKHKGGQTYYSHDSALIELQIKKHNFIVMYNKYDFIDVLKPQYLIYDDKLHDGYWRISPGWRDVDWTLNVYIEGEINE